MVQYAVFLLVVGHAPLTLLTLSPRVATLTQALVGLHTYSSVAASWFTFGYGHREETKAEYSEVEKQIKRSNRFLLTHKKKCGRPTVQC